MADKKPPEISTGSFVSWSGGKGRVDLVVTNGKVPGVEDDVEGTTKTPAARVVVWVDGKATRRKIAKSTHTLKRIAPLNFGGKKTGDPTDIVTVLAEHETKCEQMGAPAYTRVTGRAVKAVYDRGITSWPGDDVTVLSPQEWATGRVQHFVKVAAGDVDVDEAGNDTDLLDPEHPAANPDTAPPSAADGSVDDDPEHDQAVFSDLTVEQADAAEGEDVVPDEALIPGEDVEPDEVEDEDTDEEPVEAPEEPDEDDTEEKSHPAATVVPETPPPGLQPVDPPEGTEPVAPQPGEDEDIVLTQADIDAALAAILDNP
jgi:hypothetical protein